MVMSYLRKIAHSIYPLNFLTFKFIDMRQLFFILLIIGSIAVKAQEVNITFGVNMNQIELSETDLVWVVMAADESWNWTEYYEMTDEDADGIYEYTLTVASEGVEVVQQYSFAYGAAADNYTAWETPPAECANENEYREVTVPVGTTEVTLPAFYYAMCTDNLSGMVDITYQVDMNQVSDLDGAVWFNLNGDWTEWYDMTDADGDGIYTVTKSYNSGDEVFYTYGYQNGPDPDADYVEEMVPASCGGTFGVRRIVAGSVSETIPVHTFNGCSSEIAELVDVTFSVDMSSETVGETPVHMVIKGPWYWNELIPMGNDIYSGKVILHPGQTFPYTFLLGAVDQWDGEESVPEECNFGTVDAPERRFEGADVDSIMPVIPFGGCADVSEKKQITFRVDLSGVTDLYDGGGVWVNVDYWTDWYDMTDADGDKIYEFTLEMSEGEEINYVFSYQNGADENADLVDESLSGDCQTDGQRVFTAGDVSETLPIYIFGTCTTTSISENIAKADLVLFPNPASFAITMGFDNLVSGQVSITDVCGRVVKTQTLSNEKEKSIDISELTPEFYFIYFVSEGTLYRGKFLVK